MKLAFASFLVVTLSSQGALAAGADDMRVEAPVGLFVEKECYLPDDAAETPREALRDVALCVEGDPVEMAQLVAGKFGGKMPPWQAAFAEMVNSEQASGLAEGASGRRGFAGTVGGGISNRGGSLAAISPITGICLINCGSGDGTSGGDGSGGTTPGVTPPSGGGSNGGTTPGAGGGGSNTTPTVVPLPASLAGLLLGLMGLGWVARRRA